MISRILTWVVFFKKMHMFFPFITKVLSRMFILF